MSYYELWGILARWRSEFSASEFARTFSSPDPRKVLHDMVGKGFLERKTRGLYKVLSLEEHVMARNDVAAGYGALENVKMPYALTGVDGVLVWTRGGYNASRFFGYYPIHIKVFSADLPRWRRFLAKNGRKTFLAGRKPKETVFGVFYLLYPEKKIDAVAREGLMVEPLGETLRFCRENPYTFAPALEMLETRNHLDEKPTIQPTL